MNPDHIGGRRVLSRTPAPPLHPPPNKQYAISTSTTVAEKLKVLLSSIMINRLRHVRLTVFYEKTTNLVLLIKKVII